MATTLISRRDFLKGGLAAGAALTLPFVSWEKLFADAPGGVLDLLFVATGGNKGLSVIDVRTGTLVKQIEVGTAFNYPANQWTYDSRYIWGAAAGESQVIDVFTGTIIWRHPGSKDHHNYVEVTPDGHYAVVAQRFNDHFIKVGADPNKPDWLQVVADYQTYSGAQPCDTTISPDGRYSFHPDVGGNRLEVLDLNSFKAVAIVPVEPLVADQAKPYMCTAAPDGKTLFVENSEGSEGIWDVSDPLHPVEVARLAKADGILSTPVTSEFSADSRYGFSMCRDANSIAVTDVAARKVVKNIQLPDKSQPITAERSHDGKWLYVPLPGHDAVAVIDIGRLEVAQLIKVGARPVSATFLHTRLPEALASNDPVGEYFAGNRPMPANCPYTCCGPLV